MGERRHEDAKWREHIAQRLDLVEGEIGTLRQGLQTNTTITQQIADDTSWLREVLKDAAGAIRFLCRLAKWWRFTVRYVLVPVGGLLVIPYLVIYWFSHNYTLPIWAQRVIEIFWK